MKCQSRWSGQKKRLPQLPKPSRSRFDQVDIWRPFGTLVLWTLEGSSWLMLCWHLSRSLHSVTLLYRVSCFETHMWWSSSCSILLKVIANNSRPTISPKIHCYQIYHTINASPYSRSHFTMGQLKPKDFRPTYSISMALWILIYPHRFLMIAVTAERHMCTRSGTQSDRSRVPTRQSPINVRCISHAHIQNNCHAHHDNSTS